MILNSDEKSIKHWGKSALRYGVTFYGNCSKYKKDKTNRVLFQIVNSVAYGAPYAVLKSNDPLVALEILTVQGLLNIVVTTKHFYYGDYKGTHTEQKASQGY